MPYLRMFLGEQKIDEVFIAEVFLKSILGNYFVHKEKQKLLDSHAVLIRKAEMTPTFTLDTVPSSVNNFTPLKISNGKEE